MKQKIYIRILIILSISGINLFATPTYNIGIIHYIEKSDQHTIELPLEPLFSYFTEVKATKERKESLLFRNTQAVNLQRAKDVDVALKEGKSVAPVTTDSLLIESDTLKVNYIVIEEPLSSISSSLDPIILHHLSLIHELDEIIIISLKPFDTLHRLTVDSFIASSGTVTRVKDMLLPEIKKEEYEKFLLRSFMNIADKDEYHLISISSFTPSLEVNVNNGEFKNTSFIMTKDDTVTLTFRAPNYTSLNKSIMLKDIDIKDLTITLEALDSAPILIDSNDLIEVKLSNSLSISPPYIYESPTYPFTLSATKKGFSPKNIIISSPVSSINLSLQMQHLAYKTIIPTVQDAFYTSLFRSVLIGSASILLSSFLPSSNIDGVKTVHSFFNGVTIVSSIETIFRLFDYYEKTKYSIKN